MAIILPRRQIGGIQAEPVESFLQVEERLTWVQRNFEELGKRAQAVGVQNQNQVPQARVFQNGATNHTSTGNWQRVSMDSTSFDKGADSLHFDDANNRLVAVVAGTYTVTVGVAFAANATGLRGIRITRNGTPYKFGDFRPPTAADLTVMSTSDVVDLVAGGFVELEAFQSSGGNLAYGVGTSFVNLAFHWFSP